MILSVIKDLFPGFAIIVSAVIAVRGWSEAAKKDRNQHIFKERFERRVTMLEHIIRNSVPNVNKLLVGNMPEEGKINALNDLNSITTELSLYGYNNEIGFYEEFLAQTKNGEYLKAVETINKLETAVRKSLRSELGFPDP